jgi:hypothetical protein
MNSDSLRQVFSSYSAFGDWLLTQSVSQILSGIFWAAVFWGVFWGLFRLKMIREIITQFNNARGPIWDLRGTITELKSLEPVIRQFGDQMTLMDAKVDAARMQVTELQVESVSGRTETQAQTANGPATFGADQSDDANWEQLRQYWRRNTQRLEFIIRSIPDGRTRLAFDRMPRTNYPAIVTRLEDGKHISQPAAAASRDLIEMFNKHRPRNQRVSNPVVGAMSVLDQQLNENLANIERISREEDRSSRIATPTTQPPNGFGAPQQPPHQSLSQDNLA